jgi:hypothetical protein
MKTFTDKAEVIDVVYPTEKQKPTVIGLRFEVSETPHANIGKAHLQIRQIKPDGTDGKTQFGNYYPALEIAIAVGNDMLEKCYGVVAA